MVQEPSQNTLVQSDATALPPPADSSAGVSAESPDARNYSLMPVLLPLIRAKWVVLGVPFVVAVLVAVIGFFTTPLYRASTRILPPQYNQNTIAHGQNMPGGESALGNSALNLKNPTDLFVGILRSRTIIDGVLTDNELLKHYGITDMEEARKLLGSRTEINSGKDGIVELAVEDPDPARAARLANDYVRQLQAFSRALAVKEGSRRAEFFSTALSHARASLNQADMRLRETEQRTGFTRLRGQDEAILSSVRDLRSQLSDKEVQLRTLMSYATNTNPDVKLLRSEISNLRIKIKEATGDVQATVSGGAGAFVSLADAPSALMEHTQRKRDVEYWEGIVTTLGQYTELGKMDETRDLSLFQVLDEAVPTVQKSKPRIKVNVIIFWLGSTLLSMLFVLASAYVQQRRSASGYFSEQLKHLQKELVRMPWHKR